MRTLAIAVMVALAHSGPASAQADHDRLIGSCSLVAYQLAYEGEGPGDVFGARPTGRIILTADGGMAALIGAEGRRPASSGAERAALMQSTIAYTGRYPLEGSRFVTLVDAVWNKAWEEMEQARDFRLEGDRLSIDARGVDPARAGLVSVARLTWEREN